MSSWVITGGSAGIGASIIQYLIKNSNDNQNIIFTVSRRPLMLDSIPAEIRIVLSSHITCFHAGTTKVFHLQGDLTQRNILEKLKDLILHNTRKIDSLLLNAATVTPLGPLSTLEMSDFRRLFEINFFSQLELVQLLMPYFSPNSSILFMSSGIVDHPAQGVASYGSSKIALEYLMKCLAVELSRAHPQLRTCAIHPGIVQQTEMFKAYHDQGKVHFSQDHLAWLEDTLEERKQGRQEVLDLVPNIEQVAEKLGRLVIKGLSEDYHGRVVFWKDFP